MRHDRTTRAANRLQHRIHVQRNEGSEVDHFHFDTFGGQLPRGLKGIEHAPTVRDHGNVRSRALYVGGTDLYDVITDWDLSLHTVGGYRLHEQARIRIEDRRLEQTFGVRRRARDDHLEPGDVHEPRLEGLRVGSA